MAENRFEQESAEETERSVSVLNGPSADLVTTYGDGRFSLRADLRPHAREGAKLFVRRVGHFDFAARRSSDSQIGIVERAFIRLT